MKPVAESIKEAIRRDREKGATPQELATSYGVSKSTAWNIVKDVVVPPEARRPAPSRPLISEEMRVATTRRPPLSKFDLGRVGCMLAEARLLLGGYDVYSPRRESTPVDLLVGTSQGFRKVQVKVAWEDPKRGGLWRAALQSTDPGKAHAAPCQVKYYTPEEAEFFLVYCYGNDAFYVVENRDEVRELRMWVATQRVGKNQFTETEVDSETLKNAFGLLGAPIRV